MSKKLSKGQWASIGIAVLCFCLLYFGFDIQPSSQKELEKSRALNIEATSIQNLTREARESLGPNFNVIEALLMELNETENDSIKAEQLKNISGKWYEFGFPAIAGYYAEEAANLDNTAEAWSIAGTTYLIGVKNAEEEKTKTWSFQRAINALEMAVSLDPEEIGHKINLALGYIENPPADNPMKGILQLRALDEEYPDNVKVLTQLGRLSLETNQIENALRRLERAVEIEPENRNVICLLAEAYRRAGDMQDAERYENKCINQ